MPRFFLYCIHSVLSPFCGE